MIDRSLFWENLFLCQTMSEQKFLLMMSKKEKIGLYERCQSHVAVACHKDIKCFLDPFPD